MRETDTRELIERLSREAPAKAALRSPAWWSTRLVGVLAAYGLLAQLFLHVRADIGLQLTRPAFCIEVALLVLLSLSAAIAAVFSMYPDAYQKPWVLKAPYATFAVLLAFLAFQLVLMPVDPRMVIPPPHSHAMECTLCIASLALAPSAIIFGLIRKGASITPLRAGSLAVLAAASLGCLTLRLSEANDALSHLVAWHYTPTLLFAIIGAAIGKHVLKW